MGEGSSSILNLLFFAFLSLANAQPVIGQANVGCFHGLNDADTPATLPPCDSPAMLNVESNLNGTAIIKRKGFSKVSDLSCSTCPVTGSHSFIDSSGSRQDVICQNRYCLKSTNGNSPSAFLTAAASSATRWSFVDQGGILYGANNAYDPIIKYDGTTLSRPSGMPKGTILELTQDRLVVGDIQSLPNRVHYSSAGALEQFTTGLNPEDSYFDDIGAPGDKVRGLKHLNGVLYIFKTASITGCELGDQYTSRCAVVSPNIGTIDPAAITAAGSAIYFRSQDKNYWELSSSGLRDISKKIPNLVKSQSGGLAGGEQSNTQTTQADWQGGLQRPSGVWDTATLPGSIFPSSITLRDTSGSDWAGGTLTSVSTSTVSDALTLTKSAFYDDFADGNFSAGPTWIASDSSWSSASNNLARTSAGLGYIASTNTVASGSFEFTMTMPNTAGYATNIWIVCTSTSSVDSTCTGNGYVLQVFQNSGATANIRMRRTDAGAETTIAACDATTTIGAAQSWSVYRSHAGSFSIYVDGALKSSCSDSTHNTSSFVLINVANAQASWDTFNFYGYPAAGNIVSRVFDTAVSTPTYGVTSATFTRVPGESNIAFYTQTSVNGVSDWSTVETTSDTSRVTSPQRRYLRYRADFSTLVSSSSPLLTEVSFGAASTGTFRTQCIQPNSAITAWGSLSCAESLAGNGSLVYYATSAVTCAGLPTEDVTSTANGKWTQVTNNATLSIATNSAVYIGWRSLLGSATDQAQVDACTLAWNEGTPSQPSWAVYDSVRNSVYWTTTINNGAYANRVLKYDRNLQAWYPWNLTAQAPRIINNSLYFGGASSGTWNQYGLVDSDAGAGITAYWRSKDLGSEMPFHEKEFGGIAVLTKNNQAGTLTGTWTLSNAKTGTYSISLSTGAGITYARNNFWMPKSSPQQFLNVEFGNTTSTPFEILGVGVGWITKPFKAGGP